MAHLLLQCSIGKFLFWRPSSPKYFQGVRHLMKKPVLVIDADKEQCLELCDLLDEGRYSAIPLHSMTDLEKSIKSSGCQAVIMDIDTIPVDNRTVRVLTLKFPRVYFFCLSKQPFHPELKDVIGCHIYACISKPVDLEELFFWLEAVHHNHNGSDSKSPA